MAEGFDKPQEEDHFAHTLNSNFMNNNDMSNEVSNKYHTNEVEDVNRPPSRQKEPSLALGIASEYGDEGDEETVNKFTSEIVITSGIPAPMNDFTTKFTPAQGNRGAGIDIRPPSRQKTPTKAVGLDDQDESNSP